ncbi:unnamed protein product [Kuraishia capsulata CBS 1993]|uniref:VPS9 domain-containing protein n=1 Tax=Kuraishia capsulata CBS 1993 TaxID=1382522 RepID=W6MUD9_9ASCO|nr:uncharacterized protein KUCA_T00001530001 [Kuraishia capsulata CBS 1993]CDK25560.1 unnamed protein product [Kuraishia capsulata CBS 1993]
MTSRQHMPLLFNPFLNAVFNHPNPSASPLKNVMKVLSAHPEDYALLVPESESLWLNIEEGSGIPYRDFCHHTEFVEAHVISLKGVQPGKSNRRFRTLSGREVSIYDDEVIGMKGFQHGVVAKIASKELFRSFCSYLPFGSRFQLFYINRPLVGNPIPKGVPRTTPPGLENADSIKESPPHHFGQTHQTDNEDVKSLVSVLRESPTLSQEINTKFKDLFHDFNVRNVEHEDQLADAFNHTMKAGVAIFNQATLNADEIDKFFTDFSKAHPLLDINECFYTYIEMNIYDKIWPQFRRVRNEHNRDHDDMLNSSYENLNSMSLNQVGIPDYSAKTAPFTEKKILQAINEFKQLQFADCACEKRSILMSTFRALTSESSESPLVVDADTLVGLLIMVIVHSQVKDLHKHLAYIKEFSFVVEDLESGVDGYVISTFEAVLGYLSDSQNLKKLISHSKENAELWGLIKAASADQNVNNDANDSSHDNEIASQIEKLLLPFENGNVTTDSFIRARTLQGESCLMLAVQQNNRLIFETLIKFENVFTVDDVLEDRNIFNTNLLMAALQWKNNEVIDELADILLQATDEEKVEFCSTQDTHKRNLGHYLIHRHELVEELGTYIDWTATDTNKQSPFFAITRCYDHPFYFELLRATIESVKAWYDLHGRRFDYRDHVDLKGNTILHALKDGKVLELVLKVFEFVDVNALNSLKLTPLMVYVKYSRLENIKVLLGDSKLDINRYDNKYCLTAADYVKIDKGKLISDVDQKTTNEKIEELLDYTFLKENMPWNQPGAFGTVRMKYDSNHELCLFLKRISSNSEAHILDSAWHNFYDFKKTLRLIKLEYPFTFFGSSNEWFPKVLDATQKPNINYSARFKLNYHQECINTITCFLLFNPSTAQSATLREFLLTSGPINEAEHMKRLNLARKKQAELLLSDKADHTKLLKPDSLGDIQTFMKYSLNEILSFKTVFERIYRSLVFYETKARDLSTLRGRMLSFASGDPSSGDVLSHLDKLPVQFLASLQDTLNVVSDWEGTSLCSQDKLSIYVYYLAIATTELVSSIEHFINTHVSRWWDVYSELLGLNEELSRLKQIDEKARSKKPTGEDSNGSASENDTSLSPLSSISSLIGYMSGSTVNDVSGDGTVISQVSTEAMVPKKTSDPLSGSFLAEIIAGRRQKHSKRVMEKLEALQSELAVLSPEIKHTHESLAVEISNYYILKQNVMKLMLQQHARQKLRDLRFKNLALQKGFEDFKRSFI